MCTTPPRLRAQPRARWFVGFALLLIVSTFVVPAARGAPETTPTTPVSLLDRARLSTWGAPTGRNPPANSQGYQESDVIYANGQYYLFATGSQDPAWVDVYVGRTPEDLVHSTPAFKQVAPIRYPTVVKDGNTWHLWGVNPPHRWTEHWVSHEANPVNFVYVDSPFLNDSEMPVVDFAVRRHPTTGEWYGVGFELEDNAPLLLTRAPSANGPWEKLNYVPRSLSGGIFGDTGAPPWANAARPDPNLAFTADGRAWVFFTGRPLTQAPPTIAYRAGMVEVDRLTGKALGNAVVLFDAQNQPDRPFDLVSDLVLVSAPGLPDRIFGYTGNPTAPLAVMTVPPTSMPTDGRGSTDLVHMDLVRGIDVATGLPPARSRPPYHWSPAGLVVPTPNGGVGGYLAGAYLADLTFQVTFTPLQINPGVPNTVAFIGGGGPSDCCSWLTRKDGAEAPPADAALSVQIDATGTIPYVTATLRGNEGTILTLTSRVPVGVNHEYTVQVRRSGTRVTLEVNGHFQTQATYGAPLTGLEAWSLAGEATLTEPVRDPFQGVIRAFAVEGSR